MVLNFSFTEGKYNSSSLNVLGWNTVESTVREMPGGRQQQAVLVCEGLFRVSSSVESSSILLYQYDTMLVKKGQLWPID
ncbi:Dirigent protein 8 [Spatholobus suberectus]|nr:Dirigent protein 8 [Spatholobus suberectus]